MLVARPLRVSVPKKIVALDDSRGGTDEMTLLLANGPRGFRSHFRKTVVTSFTSKTRRKNERLKTIDLFAYLTRKQRYRRLSVYLQTTLIFPRLKAAGAESAFWANREAQSRRGRPRFRYLSRWTNHRGACACSLADRAGVSRRNSCRPPVFRPKT